MPTPRGSGSCSRTTAARAPPATARTGPASVETLDQKLLALAPTSELQHLQKARALQLSNEIAQARWMAFEEVGTRTPPVFLAVLVAWLTAMFASFGLFAPQNRTTITALVIGALSVATAIFLIEEMSDPLGGIIAISEHAHAECAGDAWEIAAVEAWALGEGMESRVLPPARHLT